MLLGAALVLQELREALPGTVELVFQPAEERAGGGKLLVEKGLLERGPVPEGAFALHGWPGRPLGSFFSIAGPMMAAADRFSIEIIGRGGHGARPNRCVDPITVSAQVVQALQAIVSREVDPLESVVVSVCMVHGGEADNVIPERVELKGTTRYFDPGYIETLPRRMEEVIEGVCRGMRALYRFDYEPGYIPLINDEAMVDFARSVADKYVGSGFWIEDGPRTMGGEDFAYYLDKIPGAMLHLGLGEDWPELHTSAFDFNDDAIPFGISMHCGLAFDLLG
jgi:hippurate hydrolase